MIELLKKYYKPVAIIGTIVAFVVTQICTLEDFYYRSVDWYLGPVKWPPNPPNDVPLLEGTWFSKQSPAREYTITKGNVFNDNQAGVGRISHHSGIKYLFAFDGGGKHPHYCWYDVVFVSRRVIDLRFQGDDASCIKGIMKKHSCAAKCDQ